jgi:hypothetical protein
MQATSPVSDNHVCFGERRGRAVVAEVSGYMDGWMLGMVAIA